MLSVASICILLGRVGVTVISVGAVALTVISVGEVTVVEPEDVFIVIDIMKSDS